MFFFNKNNKNNSKQDCVPNPKEAEDLKFTYFMEISQ